jgi:hypothetical protein
MVLGYLVFKGDLFTVKGGPNLGPRQVSSLTRLCYVSLAIMTLSSFS